MANLLYKYFCVKILRTKRGIIMSKGERVYYDIQEVGRKKISDKAERVLRDLVPTLGYINFPQNIDSINKIYALLENGYYPWMQRSLDRYGYDFGAELQHVIANIAHLEKSMGYDSIRNLVLKFPSIERLHRGTYEYQLDTKIGTIFIAPLTRYSKDSKIKSFALQKDTHHYCHMSAQEFIMLNPSYTAITSLVANQFGEQQYHSYIETPEGYADFANNVHMSKEDFERLMRPQVLNSVTGYELATQISELTSDDLSDDKSLLLRLAVHNQMKKGLK